MTCLRAGFASTDITPPEDVSLFGYEFRQQHLPPGNLGVHDRLAARALVLSADGPPVALVSLEVCIISVAFARAVRRRVAERIGTDPNRVIVACTHTHSGPDLQESDLADQVGAGLPHGESRATDSPGSRHAELVARRAVEAAALAAGLTLPVRATIAAAPLGLAYNRRVRTAQGVRLCWNPREYPDLSPEPADDPTCTVLSLTPLDGQGRTLLWNLGAHPVALGKTSRVVSGDWPGLACALIDAASPGTRSLFTLGACGDAHPWIATQDDPARLAPLAQAAAGFVTTLAAAARPGSHQGLSVVARTIALGGAELDVATWCIGPAILVAAPVEWFGALGRDLRHRLQRPLILATNANGWTGYWPTREAFTEGGYEVDMAKSFGRTAGDGERLVDALVDLVTECGG